MNVEFDPYSGFGTTACNEPSRDPNGGVTDSELDDPEDWYQQNHIPAERCPKCDQKTRTT